MGITINKGSLFGPQSVLPVVTVDPVGLRLPSRCDWAMKSGRCSSGVANISAISPEANKKKNVNTI